MLLSLSVNGSVDSKAKTNKLSTVGCKLANLTWLIGDWTDASNKTKESWKAVSSATYEGEGSIKKDNQWTTYESLRLVEMGGGLFFIAKVGHNPLPVAFKAEQCTTESITFVNQAHDFPKALQYHRVANNQLLIEVRGAEGKGFKLSLAKSAQDL
jgi:hypothetical protein